MIYVSWICFVFALVFVFRSVFGYEELKADNMLDRWVLALLWTNFALDFLKDITSYLGS